jgi:hypothetical protein
LLALAIAVAAVVGAVSYFGWFFSSGFKDNATLHMVMQVVNGDATARAVLGERIEITALHSSSMIEDTTTGRHEAYVASVSGSRGEGSIAVSVDTQGAMKRITSLILTGPDGRTYDLTSPESRAPPGSI